MATATRPDPSTIPDEPLGPAPPSPPAPAVEAPDDDFIPPSPGDILFEVIDGVVVECPPMGNRQVDLANRLIEWLMMSVIPQGSGRVFSEALFRLRKESRNRRRPDLAFVSAAKWPRERPLPEGNSWELAPDLAVEIVSPSDRAEDLDQKLVEYFEAGVSLVWVVYPRTRRVFVYSTATEVRILSASGELDGGTVIPGFRLSLARLFDGDPDPQPQPAAHA